MYLDKYCLASELKKEVPRDVITTCVHVSIQLCKYNDNTMR